MKTTRKFLARLSVASLAALLLVTYVVQSSQALPRCVPRRGDLSIRSTLASAGFFANIRGAEYSIKSRMDQLLSDARGAARELLARERECKHSCESPAVAVVFNSAPNKELEGYVGSDSCEKLLVETSKAPIRYENRRFESDDAAKEWYHELTQGDGADGEDLYRRCPGKCSPSYSSIAYHDGGEFVVSTSIVCGHARDRDDDQYKLSAAVRWICP